MLFFRRQAKYKPLNDHILPMQRQHQRHISNVLDMVCAVHGLVPLTPAHQALPHGIRCVHNQQVGITLLTMMQPEAALHASLAHAHIFQEVFPVKPPTKEARWDVRALAPVAPEECS